MLLLAIAALWIVSAVPTSARNLSAVTGEKLLTACSAAQKTDTDEASLTDADWNEAFFCMGFVQGALDEQAVWQVGDEQSHRETLAHFCIDNDASWPQIIRILVKWLENNPKQLNLAGVVVIQKAMADAYPCKKP